MSYAFTNWQVYSTLMDSISYNLQSRLTLMERSRASGSYQAFQNLKCNQFRKESYLGGSVPIRMPSLGGISEPRPDVDGSTFSSSSSLSSVSESLKALMRNVPLALPKSDVTERSRHENLLHTQNNLKNFL